MMTDSDKLRTIADWLDAYDKKHPPKSGSSEVQDELREMATKIDNRFGGNLP